MKTLEELRQLYPDKPFRTLCSFGYKRSETDPKLQVPDYPLIAFLDQALDNLDAGHSIAGVTADLNSKVEPLGSKGLSEIGLKKIWNRERPSSEKALKKKKRTRGKTPKKLSPEEKAEAKRKQQIAAEKRRMTAARKRIEALEDKLEIESGKTDTLFEVPTQHIGPRYDVDLSSVDPALQDVEPIFKPNPGPQSQFLMAPQIEVLYGGSAGGGKSYALLADPMRHFNNPHFNGLLVRRTTEELRELIWKSRELYPKAIPGAVFKEQQSEWRFPNGGRLWLSYLERDEDVLRYQGQAFTWIGFDELTQWSTPFAWNYLRSRLRSADPEMSQNLSLRGTTNPGGPGHHWVKKMFIDPAPPGEPFWATDIETGEVMTFPPGHEKAGQPLFRRRFIPAKLYDNPFLAGDGVYEASLLSLPETQRRRLLEGDWSVSEGAAFSEFSPLLHVKKASEFEIPHTWRRFRSCDYGYSSHSAVHWYAIDPDGQLVVYRELYTSKKTAAELARMVLEAEKGDKIAYGVLDSSTWHKRGDPGPSIAETMIREGCRWRPSDRSAGARVAGKNRLHELLKVDPETGKPGIIFLDNCRQIITDLPSIPSDPKGGDDIDVRYTSDHAYDSIRYGIMTRPRPGNPWEEQERYKAQEYYRPASVAFGY